MRSRASAAMGSVVFFLIAPGTVVGLLPWLITRWQFVEPTQYWVVAQTLGALLVVLGLIPLVASFVEFVRARGVPAPVAPTERLVVAGANRYVRNPMYVGIAAALVGQALLFGSAWLVLYAVGVHVMFVLWVRLYEEPTLVRQFGSDYETYRRNVPAWIPRLRPWDAPV
ncbi:isoprenylcysteine carboxylmethyltransferase family protein [Spiractinospora alimapuensis]|uniref:methyltransferase family protein n=1 Tax=Spiractinospora alimapuensis TaxID=2820884 RepID=UPI001F16DAA8|nr:isoprenylcysteine carboxylmethyltransferase family protein [Spiractinospora alimapuensis]QVQ50318.1 isoprenylcysteine carboxylmethyltransferase family protein [Spiractinospora alimapuensis]